MLAWAKRLLSRGEARSSQAGMGSFVPYPVMSGIAVTPETALTFTAVFAAINVLATDCASIPLGVYRDLRDGSKRRERKDPRDGLLYFEPNEEMSAFRFKQALMGHALSWGNGYAEILRLTDGTPAALALMSPRPGDTRPARSDSGRLYYEIEGGRRPSLRAEDVLHVAGLGWDGITGFSPVAMARQAIGLGIAAEQFGASWFGNGSVPKGVLQTPQKLSKEASERLRANWEMVHQGTVNGNRVAVLEEGLQFSQISIPPNDAQFLETRRFQVLEVARMYRLPPHKLGDYSQSHRANIEESNLDYLMTSLAPWLGSLEQECNRKLFSARERAHGLRVEHDMSALLRGNMEARAKYYAGLMGAGALSPNQVAAKEGLPPGPGGDGRFVSVQFLPLNPDGSLGAAPAKPGSADPDSASESAEAADQPDPDTNEEPSQ